MNTNFEVLKQRAKGTDIVALAQGITTLRRKTAHEWAGPCPKCGGHDRFTVNAKGWWFCRQCHAKAGDVIELEQWRAHCDFTTAVRNLTGQPFEAAKAQPGPQPTREPEEQSADWSAAAQYQLGEARELLFSDAGKAGQEYLLARGLEPYTWERFGLGFVANANKLGPSIVIPWRDRRTGAIQVLKFRHLHATGSSPKMTCLKGSKPNGRLFGLDQVRGPNEKPVLAVVEGELNAMSCWQAAGHMIDVVSVGAQGAALSDQLVSLALKYQRALIWYDEARLATDQAKRIPGGRGWCSLVKDGVKLDANELLQQGKLQALLGRLCDGISAIAPKPLPPVFHFSTPDAAEALRAFNRLRYDWAVRLRGSEFGFLLEAPDC